MSLELKKRFLTSIFLLILFILMFSSSFFLLYILFITSILSWFEFMNLTKKIFKKKKFNSFITNIIYFIYILIFSIVFFFLVINFQTRYFVFLTLLICITSDIGGFMFGKYFGGKKLTKISPNKTISGSIGSFVLSFLLVIFLKIIGLLNLNTHVVFYVFATCLACQLGDIFISYLKRKAKVKDTSNILPGHGGILDRIDGILLALPVGTLAFYFVN